MFNLFRRKPDIHCFSKEVVNWDAVVNNFKMMGEEEGFIDSGYIADVIVEPIEEGFKIHVHTFKPMKEGVEKGGLDG